jgi:hypothetical protein
VSGGAAVATSAPVKAAAYGQMAQFVQAVAIDRSTLPAFAETATLYRQHDGLAGGVLATPTRANSR